MGTTFISEGCVAEYTAPAGGVTVNIPVLIGGVFVIPQVTAAATVVFAGYVDGIHTLPKTAGEGALVQGQPAFWDATNAKVTINPSLGLSIGAINAAAATGDTTCTVRLNGTAMGGRVHTIRTRFTVAQVNAGATLLPAITGVKYRMVDAFAIAVGGAVTTVTTVDILATLSSSRKLVAFGQAALTQSALVRAGATGGTILADGASFTANDISTAVTVGITGSAITVATHIDFHFTYSIE